MTVNPPNDGSGTPQTLSPVSGTNTPSTAASFAHQQGHGHSPRGSISGLGVTGAGFPRTMTAGTTSSVGDGKYRRKVGFETFDAQPESLFTYTCQVSQLALWGWSIRGGRWKSPDPEGLFPGSTQNCKQCEDGGQSAHICTAFRALMQS
jgi:hypothetical protein